LKEFESGRFRDHAPFPQELYAAAFASTRAAWKLRATPQPGQDSSNSAAHKRKFSLIAVQKLLTLPETNLGPEPEAFLSDNLLSELSELVNGGIPENVDDTVIYSFFYVLYRDGSGHFRGKFRRTIGRLLRNFSSFAHRNFLIAPVVDVLFHILQTDGNNNGRTDGKNNSAVGINHPEVEKKLFRDILLPLHASNKYQFWDRQVPMLKPYSNKRNTRALSVISKSPFGFFGSKNQFFPSFTWAKKHCDLKEKNFGFKKLWKITKV